MVTGGIGVLEEDLVWGSQGVCNRKGEKGVVAKGERAWLQCRYGVKGVVSLRRKNVVAQERKGVVA